MAIKIHLYLIIFMVYLYAVKKLELFLIFYSFVLIHEIAHIVVALFLKIDITEIILLPIGVIAKFKNNFSPLKEGIIASAGPIVSILLGIYFRNYIYGQINFFIAILNLIPIYPLDGGRVLKSIINMLFGYKQTVVLCGYITKTFTILLVLFSIIFAVYFKNYYLILISLYIAMVVSNDIRKQRSKEIMEEFIKSILYE
jgi:stage IV sporulation protein FB